MENFIKQNWFEWLRVKSQMIIFALLVISAVLVSCCIWFLLPEKYQYLPVVLGGLIVAIIWLNEKWSFR